MSTLLKKFIVNLSGMNRRKKITLQLLLDALILTISFMCAMLLQFGSLSFEWQPVVLGVLLSSIMVTLLVFFLMGLYKVVVRYITGMIIVIVGKGAVVAAMSLYAASLFFDVSLHRSVPITFAIFSFIFISGLRFLARTYLQGPNHLFKQPVIIYGAGEAGRQLLSALFHSHEFDPVAFVDDEPLLKNMSIGGLHVYSPEKIPNLIQTTGARVVLLAIPSISRVRRRQVVSALEDLPLEIKTIPGMSDIISGKIKISTLRTVSAEDLLGRDPVAPNQELLGMNITGCVVMVSGAGGSIGSELCRQILNQNPSVLVLYEMSEFALYTINAELNATTTRLKYHTSIIPILGSVQNSFRLETTIKAFKVQTIYHAAAYKHVPLVEENVIESVQNNVFGTLALIRVAQEHEVENVILISTDKAVRPTNVMGATKRIAELICQAYGQKTTKTKFSMVRFGNVLGSSGSVIPRFQAQIEAGGPVTVTHKDINRYFMTIPEAAQLVIQAGALSQGGDVFVLDMGEPIKIMDLAFSMVKLYGMIPYMIDHLDQVLPEGGDIPVCITGLRKGEKLYEELLLGNNPKPTRHPRIMTASEVLLPYDELMEALDRLMQACENLDHSTVVTILHELPLNYAPMSAETLDLLSLTEQNT